MSDDLEHVGMRAGDLKRLAAVDLNLLIALDALLAERSVTEAARRLGVHQPAMSSMLSRLRRLLDDPLFVREGSRLVATPTAEAMAGPLGEALSAATAIRDRRRSFDPAVDHRTFSVVASDYVAVVLLHPLLVKLNDLAPHMAIEVRVVTSDFANLVRREIVDLAIVPRTTAGLPIGLASRDLITDRNVFAIDAGRTDLGFRLTSTQLDSLPLITFEGGPLDTVNLRELVRRPESRRMDTSSRSFLSSLCMVAGTRTAALVPLRLATQLAEAVGIRAVAPPVDLPLFTETMYWSERRDQDPPLRWLREQIVEIAERLEPTDD